MIITRPIGNWLPKSILPDAIADLVGPNVKFHHSKLNFKWSGGGEEVKWHQDISFWPHTNYSPCTAGTYIYDCGLEQGPLAVYPGSHEHELYNQYNDAEEWTGCLNAEDAAALDMDKAVFLDGPAGSVTIHNCRTLHYSAVNNSDIPRPLLLNVYSAADAFPYTYNPLRSKYDQAIVRGKPARWARHDPRPCLVPPDWSGGYTSIFALQQDEGLDNGRRVGFGKHLNPGSMCSKRYDEGQDFNRRYRLTPAEEGDKKMMTDRQKEFREVYRSRIMGWYDGYLHIAIIYAMGAAAFYIYVQHIGTVVWWEWLTLPVTFLFTNIFEWWIHKLHYAPARPTTRPYVRSMNATRSTTTSSSPTRKCASGIIPTGA